MKLPITKIEEWKSNDEYTYVFHKLDKTKPTHEEIMHIGNNIFNTHHLYTRTLEYDWEGISIKYFFNKDFNKSW